MKKILIVVSSLELGKGGGEIVAADLGRGLSKDFQVTFLTFYGANKIYSIPGEYISLEEKTNFFSKATRVYSRSKGISKTCKEKGIDIVLSLMEDANFAVIFSKLYFGNKAKVLVSVHINPQLQYRIRGKKFRMEAFYPFWMRRLYPKADEVIAVAEAVKSILEKHYQLKKVKKIYNPFHIEKLLSLTEDPIPNQYQELYDGPVFINVGRLAKQKGQDYLIRSFQAVCEKNSQAKLLILGDGPQKNYLLNLIKELGLEKNVFLLGRQENVFPFIKKSTCFVLSSLWEGFGIVILEALAMNKVVISTDCIAGPREILCPEIKIDQKINYPYFGKHGILSAPFPKPLTEKEKPLLKEETILAGLMVKMILNPQVHEQYKDGQSRIQDFDLSNITQEWKQIL